MLRKYAAATIAIALLAGCEATHLYVAHSTVVGVDGAMSSDSASGHLTVGYDRNFVTIVPKSVPIQPAGMGADTGQGSGGPREAMAVLSCSEVQVSGIFLTGFSEYLATGKAGVDFAKRVGASDSTAADQRALKELFDCYLDRRMTAAGGGGN
jgi:hypothetical protein